MIRLPHCSSNIPHPDELIQTCHKNGKLFILRQARPPFLPPRPDLHKGLEPIVDINQVCRGIEVELVQDAGGRLRGVGDCVGGGLFTAGAVEPMVGIAEGRFMGFAGLGHQHLKVNRTGKAWGLRRRGFWGC